MNCQNCKREINKNDEFCGGCGSQLEIPVSSDPDSCPSCFTKMKQNQTHCQKCGSSRDLFKKKEEFAEVSTAPSKSSNIYGIILCIVGSAIVIFASINYQSTGESHRTDNNPAVGLQYVLSFPIGIVGVVVVIAGLFSLNKQSDGK
jgi:RNA polymerase subunit RPABC4/transcription elongation factor Spt4